MGEKVRGKPDLSEQEWARLDLSKRSRSSIETAISKSIVENWRFSLFKHHSQIALQSLRLSKTDTAYFDRRKCR